MQIEPIFDFDWRPLQNYLNDRGVASPVLSLTRGEEVQLPSEMLYNWIVKHAQAPEAGLQLGRYYHISDYGVAGLVLLSAERAADAFKVIRAYVQLFNRDIADIRVSNDIHNQMRILISLNQFPGWTALEQQFHANVVASASHKLLYDLFGGAFKISGLTMPRYLPNGFDYSSFFGFPVRLRGSDIVFHFPRSQLDRPLPTANPAVFQSTLLLASESFNKLLETEMGGLKQRIVSLLESLPGLYLDIQAVAYQLKITERTLRRRLSSENSSFRQILDEVRQSKAKQLLQTQLSISKISEQLGYSDASSFRYAFKRWTGQSVANFRKLNS